MPEVVAVTPVEPAAELRRSRVPRPVERALRRALTAAAVSGQVSVGEGLRVGLGTRIRSYHGLRIGRGVAVGARSLIEVDGEIGDFCLIARHVQIVGRLDHAIDEVGVPMVQSTWVGDRDQVTDDVVRIGADVWIGAGSVVLGGVSIGAGSIIGAASVVTRDLPPFSIAAGNPARVLRQRFADDAERAAHLDGLARRSQVRV